ncbi:hypothetical protein HDU76_006255, partial [Blyttiomyces sp. JEL0837]
MPKRSSAKKNKKLPMLPKAGDTPAEVQSIPSRHTLSAASSTPSLPGLALGSAGGSSATLNYENVQQALLPIISPDDDPTSWTVVNNSSNQRRSSAASLFRTSLVSGFSENVSSQRSSISGSSDNGNTARSSLVSSQALNGSPTSSATQVPPTMDQRDTWPSPKTSRATARVKQHFHGRNETVPQKKFRPLDRVFPLFFEVSKGVTTRNILSKEALGALAKMMVIAKVRTLGLVGVRVARFRFEAVSTGVDRLGDQVEDNVSSTNTTNKALVVYESMEAMCRRIAA